MEILIGLYLCVGLCQMPGNDAFWENDTRCPMVADYMSRNQFQTLLTTLHFTDNSDLSNRQVEDKCWKIRPWLDMFCKQCLDIIPDELNSIDEQMVSFRGTHSPIRQYVKGKRAQRRYLYLFWHTIMLGVLNAWLIYRRDCKLLGVQKPLKQWSFQAEVVKPKIL